METKASAAPCPLTLEEKWERATLADNFIFYKIMSENPGVCKELLEILLGIEIDRLEKPIAEKNAKVDYDSKGIRFDVYTKGGGRCFDIEMQTAGRQNLAKRARYYQGLMDVDTLKAGEAYSALKDSYVIFLCMGDFIGSGLPVSTFENICREDKGIALNDRAYKVFFNAEKYDTMADREQKSFFKFLRCGASESAFTKKLDAMVERAKHNAQWRHQFMTWSIAMQDAVDAAVEEAVEIAVEQERARSLQEGAQQKAFETARKMLETNIGTMEQIADIAGLPLEQVEQLQQELCAAEK
ncbi:MAG: Rpn family recombination-promoting nuclease/putative transposase [Treponema sp.]|nr:Rpn family recombination-promoting nuclease/putative transposase [Treponema sp.]